MRQKSMLFLIIFILVAFIWFILISPNRLQQIDEFKGIKIGDNCPAFSCIKDDLKKTNTFKPVSFFIIFINDKLNPDADGLDDKKYYGETTNIIVEKGGHFWTSGDGKFARKVGIEHILSRSRSIATLVRDVIEDILWDKDLIKNKSNRWELEESLIIVTNGKGEILALYKNAKLGDIKKIVEAL